MEIITRKTRRKKKIHEVEGRFGLIYISVVGHDT